MGIDVVAVAVAYLAALLLRFEGAVPSDQFQSYYVTILPIGVAYLTANYFFGLYQRVWRYASSLEVTAIVGSVGVTTVLIMAIDLIWPGERPLPLSIPISGGIFTLAAFTAVRYRRRLFTGLLWRWTAVTKGYGNRVLIIGAGEEAQLLGWRLKVQGDDYHVVGYLDDDPSKQGLNIHGAKVLGAIQDVQALAVQHQVDTIIVAIDMITGEDIQEIVGLCENTTAKIKIAPDLFSFIENSEGQPLVRDVSVEDLLARESVPLDKDVCRKLLAGKVVLVTGAAGSIGSELCRQIINFQPASLLMLDNNETGLNDLEIDLFSRGNTRRTRYWLGISCAHAGWSLSGLHISPRLCSLRRIQARAPDGESPVRGGAGEPQGNSGPRGAVVAIPGGVSNQQKWDTLGAERSGAGWRSGELPEGPVVASSSFGGLSLHLLPAL